MAIQHTTDTIAYVSNTLITILKTGILNDNDFKHLKDSDITLFSPVSNIVDPPRLCLFLYQIVENPHMKNVPMERMSDNTLKYQPLVIDLHYILMPYEAVSDPHRGLTGSTIDEHRLMGKAMQILYDNSHIAELQDLDDNTKMVPEIPVKLAYNPVSLDEMTKLWQSIHNRPYRPSVCYIASPVVIESERTRNMTPVITKETRYERK